MVKGMRSPWACTPHDDELSGLAFSRDARRFDDEPLDVGREKLGLHDRKHETVPRVSIGNPRGGRHLRQPIASGVAALNRSISTTAVPGKADASIQFPRGRVAVDFQLRAIAICPEPRRPIVPGRALFRENDDVTSLIRRTALLTLAALAFAAAPARADDKIKLLIVDGQNNHNWKDSTPILEGIPGKDGQIHDRRRDDSRRQSRRRTPGIRSGPSSRSTPSCSATTTASPGPSAFRRRSKSTLTAAADSSTCMRRTTPSPVGPRSTR